MGSGMATDTNMKYVYRVFDETVDNDIGIMANSLKTANYIVSRYRKVNVTLIIQTIELVDMAFSKEIIDESFAKVSDMIKKTDKNDFTIN